MKWIGVLFFWSICYLCNAQPYRFKTYTTKDGLSSNTIGAIVKDKQGFLWIPTDNGLNRFDGNAFDCFYNNPKDSHSIASNEIQALFIDRQERLWVGSIGGISLYNPAHQNFSNYYPDSSNGKCGRWFCALQQDQTGKLWVGTWYELLIFDTTTKKFQRSGWADYALKHKPAKGNNNRIIIVGLLPKSSTEMWVLTTYGLYSVNTATRTFNWYPYEDIDDYYGCQFSHIDRDGFLWIGTYNKGLVCFNTKTAAWQRYTPPEAWNSIKGFDRIYGITPYHEDTLLYAGLDGLGLFDKRSRTFSRQLPRAEGVSSNVFNITHQGTHFWLSSTNGLTDMYQYDNWVATVKPFSNTAYLRRIMPLENQPGVLLLYNSDRKQTGLWNENKNTFTPIRTTKGGWITDEVTNWLQTDSTHGLISTEEHLYRYDMTTMLADSVTLPPPLFPANPLTVRNCVPDGTGGYWIRLRTQGIVYYHPQKGECRFVNIIPVAQEKSYPALYYDKDRQFVWISEEHEGLYRYHTPSQKLSYFPLRQHSNSNPATITAIIPGNEGSLVMADINKGIYIFRYADSSFTLITQRDGLPDNSCRFIAKDQKGYLWTSTNQGLSYWNMNSSRFSNYLYSDLQMSVISSITGGSNGYMYGTNSESYYYRWKAPEAPGSTAAIPLYIRRIAINDSLVEIDSNYILPHNRNNIMLQVGAVATDYSGNITFEYSVNSESNWTPLGQTHILNFSNLAAGNYTIRIRLKNTSNILTLYIKIVPPFWLRSWFILLVALALGLLTLLLVRRRIILIRSRASMKQKIAETEMMALKAQMNPHFIFNCINSIDNFIQDNDKENASAWLNKFAKLIRGILDNSRNDEIPFWKDWETLRLYLELEQLRNDNRFTFTMQADDLLMTGHYRIPPLIIQPYVENAIHHGLRQLKHNNGRLEIKAELRASQLHYTIEDNGIGREKAQELNSTNRLDHNSIGLQMSRERIHLFNKDSAETVTFTDLKDAAGNSTGTRVEIILYV